MTEIKERGDRMEEACGVFGIYAQDEAINVAEAAYYGLFALQHRGQESAGIAVADGKGIKHYRNLGLVPEVFDEEILHGLTGHISIGHVRYSTFGGKDVINAQPLVARCKIGMLALAHNGNLVNADALRSQMEDDGAIFQTTGGYRSHPEPDCAGKQQGLNRGRPLHDGKSARQLCAGAAGEG